MCDIFQEDLQRVHVRVPVGGSVIGHRRVRGELPLLERRRQDASVLHALSNGIADRHADFVAKDVAEKVV